MVWTPKFRALNLRGIAENALTYFETNQTDAFSWAAAQQGYVNVVPDLKRLTDSVADRNSPVFPAIFLVNDNDAVDYTRDDLATGYAPRFEVMLTGADAGELIKQARVYVQGLISMLINCPAATLMANTGCSTLDDHVVIEDTTVSFDEMKSNEEQTDYMLRFQWTATIRTVASRFA